jgi:hypothetical protein
VTVSFPKASEDVRAVIAEAERHRKFVWTAGRVLKEATLWSRLESLSYRERKLVLKSLATFLDDLANQGVLQRRREAQSIGYGDEIGFDYVRPAESNVGTRER